MKRRLLTMAIGLLWAAAAFAGVTPTTFLQNPEPNKMCQDYINRAYDDTSILFSQPTGGAIIRLNETGGYEYCIAIFCDEAQNRLFLFHYENNRGTRDPRKIITYGRVTPQELYPDTVVYLDSITPPSLIQLSFPDDDSAGKFCQPIDVAVSSCGRYFDIQKDCIYVLDQCNFRVVRFQLNPNIDSLNWISSFGQDRLSFPTALEYVDYGTEDTSDDDIFVVDGGSSKLFRFSRSGNFETSFGMRGETIGAFGYPTGIASYSEKGIATIYITDSKNCRIQNYISLTDGPISVNQWHDFPTNPVPFIRAVDLDSRHNVYVLDYFNKKIIVLSSDLLRVYAEYYTSEYGADVIDFPNDIYINRNEDEEEMEVSEIWGDSSGIQTYIVVPDYQPKVTVDPTLPKEYQLYPNYPNPFNSNTTLKFDLPKGGRVNINIYNILGEKVIALANREYPAGSHTIIWNGRNAGGQPVSSGIYFYRAQLAGYTKINKMLLLK